MSFPPPFPGSNPVAVLDRRQEVEQRLLESVRERERRDAQRAREARRVQIIQWVIRPLLVIALGAGALWVAGQARDWVRENRTSPGDASPFDGLVNEATPKSSVPDVASAGPVPTVVGALPTPGSTYVLDQPSFSIVLPSAPTSDTHEPSGPTDPSAMGWTAATPTGVLKVIVSDFSNTPLDDAERRGLEEQLLIGLGDDAGTVTADEQTVVGGVPARSVTVVRSYGTNHATILWHGSLLIEVLGRQADGGVPPEYTAALASLQLR